MKKYLVLAYLLLLSAGIFAQVPLMPAGINDPIKKKKGTIYFSWGYNRDFFSRSDLHFKNSGSDQYDFTLSKMRAKDRPGFDNLFDFRVSPKTYIQRITIPQYQYRAGYYFNNLRDEGIEINFDHVKYVMVRETMSHLKGTIHGVNYDLDTLVTHNFLQFEHTNGANFLLVNYLRRKNLFHSANENHKLGIILKPGAGIVIPKTEVSLFGVDLDNRFHVAGWIVGVEAGFRYDLFKHFFLEPTVKGDFADYMNVLTVGTGKANHHFWCFETLLTGGIEFGL